jgi:hypothetical protein
VGAETRLRVLADMARVRPVLVRGAEAMVMVRAAAGAGRRSGADAPRPVLDVA